MKRNKTLQKILFILVLALALIAGPLPINQVSAQATCSTTAAPATTLGQVKQSASVTTAGSYRVWSRIKAPNTTANSYYLQFDGGCAFNVGDATTIPANTWTWVNYQAGNTASTINVTLTAGVHNLTYTGKEADVQLDRVMLLGDTTCVPTGTGDNCNADTTAPTVAISAPTTGTSVASGATVNISATANDNVAVSKVEFYVDGVLSSTDSTLPSPFTYAWSTTGVAAGSHSLTARVYDAAGNTTTSTAISVTVTAPVPPPDTTLPTVSLSAAPTSPVVGQSTTLTAAASDNVGVSKVEFYNGTTLLGTDTASPYSFVWATTGQAAGAKSLTAKAYDAAGNVRTSTAVSITLSAAPTADTTAPTVSLTSPTTGMSATIGAAATLSATASDNVGVSRVEFYNGTTLLGTDTTSPYSFAWATTGQTAGAKTLTAKAYDAAGNVTTSTAVTFTLNAVPVVIQGDANGDSHVNGIDYSVLAAHDGQNYPPSDFNRDGTVGAADLAILLSRWTW